MDSNGEVLLTIMASLAQQESQSLSMVSAKDRFGKVDNITG